MKKSLLALAVGGVIAAPAAFAQVQLYGTLAISASNTSTGSADVSEVNDDNLSSSVLGIKGGEDLGGGLKAYIVLEGDNENKTTSFGFNRKNYLGVSGGFGAFEIGRIYTEIESNKGFATAANLFDTHAIVVGGKKAGTVRYASPSFSGVNVAVTHTNHNEGTAANTQTSSTEMTVNFKQGPLTVAFTTGEEASYDDKTDVFSLGYDFGFVDARATLIRNDDGSAKTDYNNFQLTGKLGNGFSAIGHYQVLESSVANQDYKQVGIMLVKDFSKRTAAFVGAFSRNVDGTGIDTDVSTIGLQHKF